MLALFGPFEEQRGCRSLWQGGAGAEGEEGLGGRKEGREGAQGSGAYWCWIPGASVLNAQSNLVLDPRRMPVQGPTASQRSPALAGATGAGLTVPVPLCRASSHLLPLPFLQTSMSAPSTGPATTSASTPPAASSACATRATRSTGSPTAGVGRVRWVLAACHPAGVGSPGRGQLLWDPWGHCPAQGRMGKVGSTHTPG